MKDIKEFQNFNFHSHTYRCGHADMFTLDEEYVKEYIEMGFKKIAFTDHAPEKKRIDKRNNMRMKYEKRNEYLDSIKKLKEKYKDKIEIETGYEVEYLPGEEENIYKLKYEVDKLILGQHFIYSEDKTDLKIFGKFKLQDKDVLEYAHYIEKAMELGIPDIIAHPDIFMLNHDKFGNAENEATNIICRASEKYNIPLEINLAKIFNETYFRNKKLNNDRIEIQRQRLLNVSYPCKHFWKIASNYNIKVLYGIDVHHKNQIRTYGKSIVLANEIIGDEIINKLNFIKN